jgi:hypothetical protein
VSVAKLPPLSYANDMWTGYGLEMIYQRKRGDSDEVKTCSKRTKEQVQAKNRNRNTTFQSDTPAIRRIDG